MVRALFFNLKNWHIHLLWEKTIAKHMELNGDEVCCVNLTKPIGGDDLKSGRLYEHLHAHISSKTGETLTQMFGIKNNVRIEDFFTQQDLQKIDNLPLTSRVKKRIDLNLMVEAKDIKELCAIVEFYRGQDTLSTINTK